MSHTPEQERIAALEREVAVLRAELNQLQAILKQFTPDEIEYRHHSRPMWVDTSKLPSIPGWGEK